MILEVYIYFRSQMSYRLLKLIRNFSFMNQKPEVVRNKTDHSILIAPKEPKNSLIWLHGLGDSSEGFFDFFLDQNSPVYDGTRVLLLQASFRPVTINGGLKANSWYDIKSLAPVGKQEQRISVDEVKESYKTIQAAVDSECLFWKNHGGINSSQPTKSIFVGGFSQGCSMALHYGLQSQKPLLGIIGLSGLLFGSTSLKNLNLTKTLLYHGSYDQMIPFQFAQLTYQRQNFSKNENVKFITKDLQHSVDLDQLKDIRKWIKTRYDQTHK